MSSMSNNSQPNYATLHATSTSSRPLPGTQGSYRKIKCQFKDLMKRSSMRVRESLDVKEELSKKD